MPDSVLAAIIAGTATLSASLLQLRSALLREATRGQSATRRKGRIQLIILLVVVGGAAIAGFALSQWLTSGQRQGHGGRGLQPPRRQRCALEREPISPRSGIGTGALRGEVHAKRSRGRHATGLPGLYALVRRSRPSGAHDRALLSLARRPH